MVSHIISFLAVVDSHLLTVIGAGAVGIFSVIALHIRHKRAIKAKRLQLLQRPDISDQLFTAECEVPPSDKPTVIAIRSVIAEACKLPQEKVYSNDRLVDLIPMMSFAAFDDGWDTTGFLLGLIEAHDSIVSLKYKELFKYVSAMSINAERGSGLRVADFARRISNYLSTNRPV
jgi:hypothetical protein